MMEENRRVTIKDIAEEIGVSTATVSNVIHGKTKKISDRTVAKVQEKLQESGYIPNMAAVLLAQNSSKIVCVMISNHEKYEGKMLEDPFVAQMLNSISKELSEYGYFMMIKEEADVEKIAAYASMWNMAGLILMGYCSLDYEKLRSKMHIPFVVVDSYERNIKSYIDIGVDNIEGGRLAGKYLLSKGHRQILYFADNKEDCDLDRYNGLKDVVNAFYGSLKGINETKKSVGELSKTGSEPVYYLVSMDKKNRQEDYNKMLITIRSEGITAVFAASDYYAIEFIRFLLSKGIKVPEDVSVIGFDNIPLGEQIYPALTTISQNIPLRGKTAVAMLHNLVENKAECGSVLLPVELLERESVKRNQ